MQAIRYAAVIANELMCCQEGLENQVHPGDCKRLGVMDMEFSGRFSLNLFLVFFTFTLLTLHFAY